MHQAEIIVLLFALVAILAVLACRVALPYPIVLVIGGLGLSFVPGLPEVKLNPDTVFYFILPALLYPAALFTSWRDFRRNLRPILLLAIGLVLTTMVAVAWIAHAVVPGLPWGSDCLAAGRDCSHSNHSPAWRAASYSGNSRGRELGE